MEFAIRSWAHSLAQDKKWQNKKRATLGCSWNKKRGFGGAAGQVIQILFVTCGVCFVGLAHKQLRCASDLNVSERLQVEYKNNI